MNVVTSVEGKRGCGYRKPGPDGFSIYLMGSPFGEPCERLPFPLGICPCCGEGIRFYRGWRWIEPRRLFGPAVEPVCDEDRAAPAPLGRRRAHNHKRCRVCSPEQFDFGLMMWVGREYSPLPPDALRRSGREFGDDAKPPASWNVYRRPSFLQEGMMHGVSRKIAALPGPAKDRLGRKIEDHPGLEIGKTPIYMAHLDAIPPWPAFESLHSGTSDDPEPAVFCAWTPRSVDIVVDSDKVDEVAPKALALAEELEDQARLVKVIPAEEMAEAKQVELVES